MRAKGTYYDRHVYVFGTEPKIQRGKRQAYRHALQIAQKARTLDEVRYKLFEIIIDDEIRRKTV